MSSPSEIKTITIVDKPLIFDNGKLDYWKDRKERSFLVLTLISWILSIEGQGHLKDAEEKNISKCQFEGPEEEKHQNPHKA
jgi:hypothetical protein